MAGTQTLTDHDAIREWATTRGATPARARGGGKTELTFDFHQLGQRPLQAVGWERWFEAFDRLGLALLVDHNTPEMSDRFRLVKRKPGRPDTGAARRRSFAPGGNQPVGVQRQSKRKQASRSPKRAPQRLRKLVRARARQPEPPAPTGPVASRRRKGRALPKRVRAPRTPKP
jgi:hypothetical protein